MRGPVCSQDIKTGKLCLICEAKLKAGQITDADFAIMKAVNKLENKKFLISTEIVRAFDVSGMVLVFTKGNVGALIGKGGKNIKSLEATLGKKVRIIEVSPEPKETIQQVLGKVRISALNKVFKRDGEELKVVVDARDKRRIGKVEELEHVLKDALKTPIAIEFA